MAAITEDAACNVPLVPVTCVYRRKGKPKFLSRCVSDVWTGNGMGVTQREHGLYISHIVRGLLWSDCLGTYPVPEWTTWCGN